jgi:hypothetical protein
MMATFFGWRLMPKHLGARNKLVLGHAILGLNLFPGRRRAQGDGLYKKDPGKIRFYRWIIASSHQARLDHGLDSRHLLESKDFEALNDLHLFCFSMKLLTRSR